jgi:hypothetical protein
MKPEENPEEYLLAAMERQAKRAKFWIEDSMWMEPCAGRTWWGEGGHPGTKPERKKTRKRSAKAQRAVERKNAVEFVRLLKRRKRS